MAVISLPPLYKLQYFNAKHLLCIDIEDSIESHLRFSANSGGYNTTRTFFLRRLGPLRLRNSIRIESFKRSTLEKSAKIVRIEEVTIRTFNAIDLCC